MPLGFFGSAPGAYSSQLGFQRLVDPSTIGFFVNLEQADLLRIQRYGEASRMYLGAQWNHTREDGDPFVTVNYLRKLVDKGVEFLAGKGFSIQVPEGLAKVTLPLLREVWEYNNHNQFVHDAALTGGITGDVFVLVTYEEPTPLQRRVNPYSQGKIRINLLGSEQVFPVWDPLNHEVLTAVRIETIFYADRGLARTDRDDRADHAGRTLHTKRFTQIITREQIVEQFHGEAPTVKPNLLGEIPLVHIKNLSFPREYYGLSDMQDLIDLQRKYNEAATDLADIVHYQAAPVTVITGARAKGLERGPKALWSLARDAEVKLLTLDTDLPASQEFLATLKKALHELSDVPEGALGAMQPISNTSGTALHMQWQPLVAKTAKKRVNYGIGFQQINYFVLRVAQTMGLVRLPMDVCSSCAGRIVETELPHQTQFVWQPDPASAAGGAYAEVPLRKKRCFHADPQTLAFMDPREMRLKFVRQYGFGTEVREAPFWAIERETRLGKPSYWDYAADQRAAQQGYHDAVEEWQQEAQAAETDAAANPPPQEVHKETGRTLVAGEKKAPPPPAPPVQRVPALPPQFIDVPEEPEYVTAVFPMFNPATGELVEEVRQAGWLVPTGCQDPRYQNPFENKVEFHDALPKDDALEAQKFQVYQANGWVDAPWVRAKISEIAPDAAEIEKRMQSSGQAAPQDPAGGFQELAPSSETGEDGDATPLTGQADAQQKGKEQAEEKRSPGKA